MSEAASPVRDKHRVAPDRYSATPATPFAGPVVVMVSHASAGGAQEIMANLAEELQRRGKSVRLMALYPTAKTVRDTRIEWTYLYTNRPRNPIDAIRMIWSIVRFFRREQPEAIYSALPAANVTAAACAWMAGLRDRVVITHHSPAETHNRLIDGVDDLTGALGSVRAIVSVSNTVSQSLDLKPDAYRAKRRVITNAVPPDVDAQLAALAQRRAGRTRGRRVVATGRLADQKNYPVLIRAMALLPDVVCDIVGGGPNEAALRSLAAEVGADSRITFHGQVTRARTLDLLAQGDIFSQMSLYEGHSLALVEAAKLGIPLIVSSVPVQIEGVTAADGSICGLVIGTHDHEALASAIAGLLNDEATYRAATADAIRLGEESSFELLVDKYQRLMAL